MNRGTLVACALAAAACSSNQGSASAPADAGSATDAGAFASCPNDPDAVTARGYSAELDGTCTPTLPSDYRTCVLGRDDLCATTDLLSSWKLARVPNAEVTFRITRDGSLPRLKPAHPFGCTFDTLAFALPQPAILDTMLAAHGGFATDKAYVLVFAETDAGSSSPGTAPLCTGNAAGFAVTSSKGKVVYADATGLALDANATATTTSGLALVVIDAAAPLTAPETIRVTATRPSATPSCRVVAGHNWDRSPTPVAGTSAFAADAPAAAGHVTYGLFVLCDR